jgi:GAF domain-containing protein
MIRNRIASWIQPTSERPEIAQRQAVLNVICLGLAVVLLALGLILLIPAALGMGSFLFPLAFLLAQPFLYLSYWLGKRDLVVPGAAVQASVVFMIVVVLLAFFGIGHASMVGFAIVITIAGILIGVRASVVFLFLSATVYGLVGFVQNSGGIPTATSPLSSIGLDTFGVSLVLSTIVVLNWLATRETERARARERSITADLERRRDELEMEVQLRTSGLERRAIQLETTAEIAKIAAELTEPDILMSQSIELIRERFGFYHASIFLLEDTGTWAELIASTGEAGRKMLARRHRLAVGSASVVGWVTANRLPRVAQDVEADPYHFKNPLLPDTRSELAVPLIVGRRLLGALDVQSTEGEAFTEDDVRTMEAIAGELAISIDSARAQREMRLQLERMEGASRAQVRQAWSRLAQSGIRSTIYLNQSGEADTLHDDSVPVIDQSVLQGEIVVAGDGHEVAVPVRVRGETVATIAARRPPQSESWSEDEIALIEAVASQAALALENARQRSEEIRRVQELEVINRVSQAVSQMLRLDTLFRVVHRQVNQVLGATDLSIALYDPDTDQLTIPYSSEGGEPTRHSPIPVGDDLTSIVIRSRQPLLLAEGADQQAAMFGVESFSGRAKSWLGVPMLLGDDILGVITVQDFNVEQRYSEDDAALMTTIASQVASGIQNAQLLDQVQRAARRERLIHEITSKVRRSPDLKSILDTTSREVGKALNAARTTVRLGVGAAGSPAPPSKTVSTNSEHHPDDDEGS